MNHPSQRANARRRPRAGLPAGRPAHRATWRPARFDAEPPASDGNFAPTRDTLAFASSYIAVRPDASTRAPTLAGAAALWRGLRAPAPRGWRYLGCDAIQVAARPRGWRYLGCDAVRGLRAPAPRGRGRPRPLHPRPGLRPWTPDSMFSYAHRPARMPSPCAVPLSQYQCLLASNNILHFLFESSLQSYRANITAHGLGMHDSVQHTSVSNCRRGFRGTC
jgi:hypothetical protein